MSRYRAGGLLREFGLIASLPTAQHLRAVDTSPVRGVRRRCWCHRRRRCWDNQAAVEGNERSSMGTGRGERREGGGIRKFKL